MQNDNQIDFQIVEGESEEEAAKRRDLAHRYLQFIEKAEDILKNPKAIRALYYLLQAYWNKYYSDVPVQYQSIFISICLRIVDVEESCLCTIETEKSKIKVTPSIIYMFKEFSASSAQFCLQLCTHLKRFFQFFAGLNVPTCTANAEFFKNLLSTILHLTYHTVDACRYLEDDGVKRTLEEFSWNFGHINDFYSFYIFMIFENFLNQKTSKKPDTVDYDFYFLNDPTEPDMAHLSTAMRYLLFLGQPERIVGNNCTQPMNSLFFITNYLTVLPPPEITNDGNSVFEKYMELLLNLIKHLHVQVINNLKLMEKEKMLHVDTKATMKRVKQELYDLELIITTIQNASNHSIKFCYMFHKLKSGGLAVLFNIIKEEYLCSYLVKELKIHDMSVSLLDTIFQCIVGTLSNLSRYSTKYKASWEACDALQTCLRLADRLGSIKPHYRTCIYMIIAHIATDDRINTLSETQTVIIHITKLVAACAHSLESGDVQRLSIQMEENEEPEDICVCSNDNVDDVNVGTDNSKWHLAELLAALYKLAVNDNLKKAIYKDHKINEYLRTIIYKGNYAEKELGIWMLYQLCFDDDVARDIECDKKLCKYIEELSTETETGRAYLARKCKGILWNVISENIVVPTQESDAISPGQVIMKTQSEKSKNKHIMISYNRESRETCLKIKAELEKLDYLVWIDVEDIRGSSLESMASAVELSSMVLIGMTEKYKLSSNCRLEAEYAVTLNKPIVPLILQKDYKPDGWLGIILGSKMFIHFKKYDFEECIRRLKNEVETIMKMYGVSTPIGDKPSNKQPKPNGDTDTGNSNEEGNKDNNSKDKDATAEIVNWSETDVNKWLQANGFHPSINETLKSCNGKILSQMHSMLKNTPEFFYCSLRSECDTKLYLKDIAKFSFELKSLFKDTTKTK